VLLVPLSGATPLFGAGDAPFVPLGPATGPPADWITENRDGILVGSSGQVYGADFADRLTLRKRYFVDENVTSAVAVGRRLLLVKDGERLAILEPHGGDPVALELDPPARGGLTPVVLGDLLMLAEDGVGLRFLRITTSHHDGHFELTPISRLPLAESFTAVAATMWTAYVATASGLLYEIDGAALGGPRLVRQTVLDDEVHALAANNDRVLALGNDGLTVYGLTGDRLTAMARTPDVRGDSLQINGRLIYVAGPDGVQAWRDRTAGSQTHLVSVANDFFSPANLAIDVNDSVQWNNAALGALHNVKSCIPEISGCYGQTSIETFTSGPVAGAPWTYTYQFTRPGPSPYVCISHLPFMTGLVQVGGSVGTGGRVPIDDIGLPVLVGKLTHPATDPSRLVWWLIVPTGDAAESQSSLSDIRP